jgi:dTMP kinase
MGLLITFEGIEGSGKSTQVTLVQEFLEGAGYPCLVTREPGGTGLGKGIRRLVLDDIELALDPLCELFMIEADRAQHVAEVLLPALERRRVVVCDRFADATVAYQGFGRGLDLDLIRTVNGWATRGLVPDLTIVLDVPVALGISRIRGRDRFEREDHDFHQRVRDGYLRIAEEEPGRVRVVAGDGDRTQVQTAVCQLVAAVLKERNRDLSGYSGA